MSPSHYYGPLIRRLGIAVAVMIAVPVTACAFSLLVWITASLADG